VTTRALQLCAAFLAACVASCVNDPKPAPIDGGADARFTASARLDAATDALSAADAAEAGPADDAMPDATSLTLTVRARHLLEAIAKDSPDLATDVIFPRDGYLLARDDKDPAKVWDAKLKPAFARDVGRLNKRMKGAVRAIFVSFELGKQIVRITPKKHDYRSPLWRVKHSSLQVTIDGRDHRIDVAEMVAWRGNWYVTRLR